MILKTPAILALIASLCGGQTLAAETFRQIRGRDISARFAGMEMTDEVHWARVFAKDGTDVSFSLGIKSQGKWRVEKNQLCIDRSKSTEDNRCYEVWISGKNVQLRQPGIDIHDEGILQKPVKRSL